jgi:hypothetical protein
MSRKTIKITDVKSIVNEMLANSICGDDERQGMIEVLTTLLFSTDNYEGFRYLTESEVPAGQKPGIRWVNGKAVFTDIDRTRIRFS